MTNRFSLDIESRIDSHLNAVEKELLKANQSRETRRGILDDLEVQLRETLSQIPEPGIADVERIVQQLDPPASYGTATESPKPEFSEEFKWRESSPAKPKVALSLQKLANQLSIVAAIVFFASFLPWGDFRPLPQLLRQTLPMPTFSNGPGEMFSSHSFPTFTLPPNFTITLTGWNGSVNLFGLSMPNWVVVISVLGIAVGFWMRVWSMLEIPRFLPLALVGYGIFHMLYLLANLSPGIGSIITLCCLIWMLKLLVSFRDTQTS